VTSHGDNPTSREEWARLLRRVRDDLNFDQEEMGAELGVTREWISKLENRREDFSELIILKLKALQHGGSSMAVGEPSSLFGGPAPNEEALVDELDKSFQEIISSAKGDLGRLGWIREQLAAHLAIPGHWKEKKSRDRIPSTLSPAHSDAMRRVLSQERRQAKPASHPSLKKQGGAGR